MPIITKQRKVLRRTVIYPDLQNPGYVTEPSDYYQDLVDEYRVFGYRIGQRRIDTEAIPHHVMVSLGCFGDTDGWVSKFAEYIK